MKRIFLILTVSLLSCVQLHAQSRDGASMVTIDGRRYYVHTVEPGETMYSLERRYDVTARDILYDNPQTAEGLQPGQTLKIPALSSGDERMSARKRNRIFDTHTVTHGETLYSISRYYGISVNILMEDNPGLDPSKLSIGQKINIRKSEKGESSPTDIAGELEEYRDAINSISTDAIYHIVESGETLYGLSRMYGVREEEIIAENRLSDGLKTGSIIKIPGRSPQSLMVDGQFVHADSIAQIELREQQRLEYEQRMERRNNFRVRSTPAGSTINVALLLPFTGSGNAGRNFLDFYQGFLTGLDALKSEGISVNLNVYDTEHSTAKVARVAEEPGFAYTDLIVGPVYEESLDPILEFAEREGIAVVTPLATIKNAESPALFQMAPTPETRFDKLRELLTGGKNIIYINTANPDSEMDAEIRPFLPVGSNRVEYSRSVTAGAIERMMDRNGENIIIISCTNEYLVDEILAKISSFVSNLSARSIANVNLRVVGNSRWTRFRGNLDRELFFKLNVCFVSSYHADRSNDQVRKFDNRYLSTFGNMPSLYAYRGYDAALLFISSMMTPGSQLVDKVNTSAVPLQMPYFFTRGEAGERYVNTEWVLVSYRNDFTIEIQ